MLGEYWIDLNVQTCDKSPLTLTMFLCILCIAADLYTLTNVKMVWKLILWRRKQCLMTLWGLLRYVSILCDLLSIVRHNAKQERKQRCSLVVFNRLFSWNTGTVIYVWPRSCYLLEVYFSVFHCVKHLGCKLLKNSLSMMHIRSQCLFWWSVALHHIIYSMYSHFYFVRHQLH